MKEIFELPTLEVVEFATDDIITTSLLFNDEDSTGSGPKVKW